MQKNAIVEETLRFYELPKKLNEKITKIAIRRIKELGIDKTEEIYIYMSNLIDKFLITAPYEEKFFTRLDSARDHDSKTLEHELIEIPHYIESQKKDQKEWAKEKLKKLSFDSEKPLIILGRKLIQIEPFIKFRRREYNQEKTPVNIYNKYSSVFKGKSRTQLFLTDPSLYESLRRRNLLEKVISFDKRLKGISEKKQKQIIDTFKITKSPTKTAKILGLSRATIDKYTLKQRLRKLNKRTGNPGYSEKMLEDVVDCLKKCKSASKVAECYGINRYTVIKHGRKVGVPIQKRGGKIENILKSRIKNKTLKP